MAKKEVSILMSHFDNLVLSPKEIFKVLRRKGLDTSSRFKAFLNGDKGIIYVGTAIK